MYRLVTTRFNFLKSILFEASRSCFDNWPIRFKKYKQFLHLIRGKIFWMTTQLIPVKVSYVQYYIQILKFHSILKQMFFCFFFLLLYNAAIHTKYGLDYLFSKWIFLQGNRTTNHSEKSKYTECIVEYRFKLSLRTWNT